jgi:hypothetical protein
MTSPTPASKNLAESERRPAQRSIEDSAPELNLIPLDSADAARLAALLHARVKEVNETTRRWGAIGEFAHALRQEGRALQTLLSAICGLDEGSMLAVDHFLGRSEAATTVSTVEQRMLERALAGLQASSADDLLWAVRALNESGERCRGCSGNGWCERCQIREQLAHICVACWQIADAKSAPPPRAEPEQSGVFRTLVRGARNLGQTARKAVESSRSKAPSSTAKPQQFGTTADRRAACPDRTEHARLAGKRHAGL